MADIYKDRLYPILGKFGNVGTLVNKKVDGIMMDIGVSSGQIETPERGFSYKLDGPLDMRMFSRGRQHQGVFENEHALLKKSISAYEIVNFFSREQIADIIYQVIKKNTKKKKLHVGLIIIIIKKYGGDRLSRKIAAAIVTARQEGPIETTSSLATIIQKACPQPRWQRGNDDMVRNSAARTFQALRISINDEVKTDTHILFMSSYSYVYTNYKSLVN
jgi:16S rRNA (cytosine1402-N4)-methyltransferase